MNHAANVNRKRLDLSIKERRNAGQATVEDELNDVKMGGKKLTDMTTEEYANYLGSDFPRPRVIKTKKPSS